MTLPDIRATFRELVIGTLKVQKQDVYENST